MSTTIELAPQLQAELTRQAAKRGVGVDAYAAGLLENATRFSNDPAPVADNPQSAPSREIVAAIKTLYVELAQRSGCPLAMLDQPQRDAAAALGVQCL